MSKTLAVLAAGVALLAGLPFVAVAQPQHPNVGINVDLDRVGGELRLRAQLENQGDKAAKNLRLDLALPDGAWRLDDGPGSCTGTGSARECRLQELAGGRTWTVTGSLSDAPCGQQTAKGRVQTPEDRDAANDADSDSAPSACAGGGPGPGSGLGADISVQKLGSRDYATVTFTLIVTNLGPHRSDSVLLVDDLPNIDATWRVYGPDDRACAFRSIRHLECVWSDVDVSEQKMVRVSAEALLCKRVENTAYVSGSNDPEASNDASTAVVYSLCPV